MRCIECGHELKDGAVFCIRCGAMQVSKDKGAATKSGGTGSTQTVKPATRNTASGTGQHTPKSFKPTPRRSKASIVAPIVGVVAALAAVGALAMFVINPGSSGSSDSSPASAAQTTVSSSTSSASTSSTSSSSASSKSASSKSSKSSSSASSGSAANASTTNNGNASTDTGSTANNGQAANGGYVAQQETYAEPAPQQTYATDDSSFRGDTSSRYYSTEEVQNMSNEDLFYARNEIFARHGRMLSDPNLQANFNSKTWYNPIYSPAEFDSLPSPLNDYELKNVQLMLSTEQARGSAYL